ncbi:MAG: T9SS type A sorting domain-containing protein [Bacteroidia bacterium]
MKTPLSVFLTLGLCFPALSLLSQNYRPFHPHWTYVYDCSYRDNSPDSVILNGLYSFRIDSVETQGSDTLYYFNRIGRENLSGIRADSDNIMGQKMIEKPGGDYLFVTSDADTFFIRTQVPLQTSWTFHADSAVTATLILRSENNFLGVTDSLLTITLSTGDTLLLSQTYGLIQTKVFLPVYYRYYQFGNTLVKLNQRDKIVLHGIEEISLGGKMPWLEDIYDFEIGERFTYGDLEFCESGPNYIYTIFWTEVLDKWWSNSQDTVFYRMKEESMYVFPYGVNPYTLYHDTIYYGPKTTLSSFVINNRISVFSPPFLSYDFFDYHIIVGPIYNPKWNNHLTFYVESFTNFDSVNNVYNHFLPGSIYSWGEGLGSTGFIFQADWGKCLICAEKLTDTVGTYCIRPEMILSREKLTPKPFLEIYPNPADREITLSFCGEKYIGDWTAQIVDAQGKVVVRKSGKNYSICLEELWDLSSLPSGIYTLILSSEATPYPVYSRLVKSGS